MRMVAARPIPGVDFQLFTITVSDAHVASSQRPLSHSPPQTKVKGKKSKEVERLQQQLAELKKQALNKYADVSAADLVKKYEAVERQIKKVTISNKKQPEQNLNQILIGRKTTNV